MYVTSRAQSVINISRKIIKFIVKRKKKYIYLYCIHTCTHARRDRVRFDQNDSISESNVAIVCLFASVRAGVGLQGEQIRCSPLVFVSIVSSRGKESDRIRNIFPYVVHIL